MAIVNEKASKTESEADIRELLAKATKFFQRYESFGKQIDGFMTEYKSLRSEVVQLLNARETLEKLNREAQINLAKAEREAQIRLQSVEAGQRALVERMSERERALNDKLAEVEKREAGANEARNRYELLASEAEVKLRGLNRVTK